MEQNRAINKIKYAIKNRLPSSFECYSHACSNYAMSEMIDLSEKSISMVINSYDPGRYNDPCLIYSFLKFIDKTEGNGRIKIIFGEGIGNIEEKGLVVRMRAHYRRKNKEDSLEAYSLRDNEKVRFSRFAPSLLFTADLMSLCETTKRNLSSGEVFSVWASFKGYEPVFYIEGHPIRVSSLINLYLNNSDRII